MKIYLSILLALNGLLLAGCSRSPQEKAVSTIVHHLEKTLKDPSSYIPVQYAIEEVFAADQMVLPPDSNGRHSLNRDTFAKSNTPNFTGWKIAHKFKCRSESGVVKDTQLTFWVSSRYDIENIQ